MTQSIFNKLKKLGLISALSVSLIISAPVKADHERDILLLAAPFLLYNILQDHSYQRHTRIQRHHRGHHDKQRHYKPRRYSHSRGHYSKQRRHHRRH